MPWLSVTGTPTSATPWWCSASVRTAHQYFPPRTDARSGARVNWSRTARIEVDQVADAWKVLPGQAGVCLLAGVPAGEGDDPQDVRVGYQVGIEVIDLGKGQLQHDVLVCAQGPELFEDGWLEQLLGLGLARGVDVDLGLEDRYQASGQNLTTDLELLVDRFWPLA